MKNRLRFYLDHGHPKMEHQAIFQVEKEEFLSAKIFEENQIVYLLIRFITRPTKDDLIRILDTLRGYDVFEASNELIEKMADEDAEDGIGSYEFKTTFQTALDCADILSQSFDFETLYLLEINEEMSPDLKELMEHREKKKDSDNPR